MIAVPFFFFFAIELMVILLDGAAASRNGRLAPGTSVGFGEPPPRFALPMKLPLVFPLLFPQKTYCGLIATPETDCMAPAVLVMKLAWGAPPATATRPTWLLPVAQYRKLESTATPHCADETGTKPV